MRLVAILLLLAVSAACQRLPEPGRGAAPAQADSLVLDRSYCIVGLCPSYRLSIARTGAVRFRPRNFGDTTRTLADSIAPEHFAALLRDAARARFWELPGDFQDTRYCRRAENDFPFATVTVFAEGGSKEVRHYLGCRNAPPPLRLLEERIDSVAGVQRWITRPSHSRPWPGAV